MRGPAPALRATEIAGDLAVRSIDELPILARARGARARHDHVRDAEELRVKESDRIATTCAMLRAFGVACEARPDGFVVEGRPDRPLVAGARPRRRRSPDRDGRRRSPRSSPTARRAIDDADNVATSYPGFAAALRALGADLDQRD